MRLLHKPWRVALLLVMPMLSASTDGASLPPLADPYAAPPAGVVATLINDSRFGKPGADTAIRNWLTANPAAAKHDRSQLLQRLCSDAEIFGRYQTALRACGAQAELTLPAHLTRMSKWRGCCWVRRRYKRKAQRGCR